MKGSDFDNNLNYWKKESRYNLKKISKILIDWKIEFIQTNIMSLKGEFNVLIALKNFSFQSVVLKPFIKVIEGIKFSSWKKYILAGD